MWLFWVGGCGTLYATASRDFLLQGADPWTFGQIEPLVTLLPSAISLFASLRARSDTHIAVAKIEKEIASLEIGPSRVNTGSVPRARSASVSVRRSRSRGRL